MSSGGGFDEQFAHELHLIAAAKRQEFDGNGGNSANAGLRASKASRPLPRAIGKYRIVRRCGRGGMGVVYEAEQEHPRRSVALKVIRGGPFVNERRIGLFEREIQTLARLKHANIAAIYEAGCTEDGQHFFAMELVQGESLMEYAGHQALSIRATLELFAKICEAISYAHQRGVIHRDLKPSNIMIDADGNPHVLDFGLAKIIEDDGDASEKSSALTRTGHFVGSLSWASPEQASELPGGADVRSDVYSLGVVLFQLLTDEFPYPVNGPTKEVLENILSSPPTKPGSLNHEIDDETATIVLKCLAKEPQQRYQSVGELAGDIRRRLADEPIEAKRESGWYMLRKWLWRYRWQSGALGAIATMLVILAVSMSIQSVRLRDERDTLRDLTHAYLQRARSEGRFGDREVSNDMLSNLAQLFERQILLDPDDVEWRFYLYAAQDRLFRHARERGDLESAELHCDVVLRETRRLVEMEPENPKWQRATAIAIQRRGELHYAREQYQEAYDAFKEESEFRETFRGDESAEPVIRKERAMLYDWLAKCCFKLGGRRKEEEAYRLTAWETLRDLSTSYPENYDFAIGRADAANNLAAWHIRLQTVAANRAATLLLDEASDALELARLILRRPAFELTQILSDAIEANREGIGIERGADQP